MMKCKKIVIGLLLCMMVMIIPPMLVSAQNNGDYVGTRLKSSDSMIVPFADFIVVRFRDNHNKIQYRRWNETKSCWVDPYWINL